MESLYQICVVWSKPGHENFNRFSDDLFFDYFYRNGSRGILYSKKDEYGASDYSEQIFDLLLFIRFGNSVIDAGHSCSEYKTVAGFAFQKVNHCSLLTGQNSFVFF